MNVGETKRWESALVSRLRTVVGDDAVVSDSDMKVSYEVDWTGRFRGSSSAVVLPRDASEVAGVLEVCAAAGVGVVTQGGNTGLVGASVPRNGEVVLSLRRLCAIGAIDTATAQVEVGAGATLASLAEVARRGGFEVGLDFAARESATIGGIAATDAGGILAMRYGTARSHIIGLEAVLGDGTLISRMSGLVKDNAGLALPALLIGSEGVLGVITRVLWRLLPRRPRRVTALVSLDSTQAAIELLGKARGLTPSLEAAEFLSPEALAAVTQYLGASTPIRDAAIHVLMEVASDDDPLHELAEILPDDAIVADDTETRLRLWKLRESQPEAIAALGVPHKLDVGVPLRALGEFIETLPEALAEVAPDVRAVLFGHLGDGNVHVNLLGARADDQDVDAVVLRLAARLGGTISAEHGVGVAKAHWLSLVRSDQELSVMRRIKEACDPSGILNPGVMLEMPGPTPL